MDPLENPNDEHEQIDSPEVPADEAPETDAERLRWRLRSRVRAGAACCVAG